MVTRYRKSLALQWGKVLQKSLKYKKPAIINLAASDIQKPSRLYVAAMFIKSGKHDIMFRMQDKEM